MISINNHYKKDNMKNKRRFIYLIITCFLVVLGLSSRKWGYMIPDFLSNYSGDTIWAAMVYFGLRILFPSFSELKVGISALLFSYGIEFSQLYQADWINAIRNTTLGALILGHGFLWSDLLCYTAGIVLSIVFDWLINKIS